MISISRFVNKIARVFGLKVSKLEAMDYKQAGNWKFVGNGWDVRRLREPGLQVRTVVDVGVAGGTPTLYDAFPDADLLLVEPLSLFNEAIRTNIDVGSRSIVIVNCAAGEVASTLSLKFIPDMPLQASLRDRKKFFGQELQYVDIKVRPLDDIVGEYDCNKPYLLKIDVEGHEVDVLRGAGRCLREAVAVIVEVSLDDSYPGNGSNMIKVDSIMREHGYLLRDILDASVQGSRAKRHVKKADLLYVRANVDE